MKLELISFKLCPFVQRAVITLLYKRVPYDVTYIDLTDPPPWFLDISPFGKVPVLRVDGDHIVFESAVINEFLDEITPDRLLPDDPLRRAQNRAWIEFGSACIMDHARLIAADSQKRFDHAKEELEDKLERLEETLGDGPYFNGSAFSLTDAAYAPLFLRLDTLREAVTVLDAEAYPKLNAWAQSLLALPAVQDSAVPEFPSLYRQWVRGKGGHLASRLAD